MRSKHIKKTGWAILASLLILLVLVVGASFYLVDFALNPHRCSTHEALEELYSRNPECKPWIDSLQRVGAWCDTFAVINGTRLHALYIPAAKPTNKVALLIHGYKDTHIAMLNIGSAYHRQLGYNLFLPDLFAHGRSGGGNIQMGWNDRLDVMKWITIADGIFRGDSASTRMVVHGVSMGAATTMALSGEQLPACVRCFVEDCGYTSVYDEFKHELSDTAMLPVPFPIPEWPILPIASKLCEFKHGWNFKEASMLEQVRKCRLPMLFIHGDNDDFVPTAMVYPLFQAKQGRKALYIGKGSRHARTYNDHHADYVSQLLDFLGNSMY